MLVFPPPKAQCLDMFGRICIGMLQGRLTLGLVLIPAVYLFFRERRVWKWQREEQVNVGSSQGACCWWTLGPILLLTLCTFPVLNPSVCIQFQETLSFPDSDKRPNYSAFRYLCIRLWHVGLSSGPCTGRTWSAGSPGAWQKFLPNYPPAVSKGHWYEHQRQNKMVFTAARTVSSSVADWSPTSEPLRVGLS